MFDPPEAAITRSIIEPRIGEEIEFFSTGSTSGSGPIIRWLWDFGDGSPMEITANPEIGTADYVIWWNMPDQQPAEWYIRSRTSDGHIVEMDSTLPQGTLRWTGWLETIAAVARKKRP